MKPLSPSVLAAALAGLLALAHVAPAPAQSLTQPVDSIVAQVDEDVILRSELDRAVANVVGQYAANPQQLPPRDILEKQVLDRLVMMRLQVGRATDSGIRVSDAEVQQAVSGIANQNHLTVDQLRQRLAGDGIGFGEFQSTLRDELMVQRLRQRFVQSRVQVSEAEIDQMLATREVATKEVHLANLQVALPEGATPEQVRDAATKIDSIRTSITSGQMDFRTAAVRYSQAQNALEGGDIGWRSYDALPPSFATVIRAMQPGDVSEPMRAAGGFQIVQVVEVRDAQPQKATQYHAADIMVKTSDVVSAEQARQKIQALRDRLVAGEAFDKVASSASDDTMTRGQGGDMGWFQIDQWGGAIAAQIQQLADGELSPVFQSDVGFHLIKRLGKREQDVTDENRRNQARQAIGERKGDEEYERFLRQMRSEAFVDSRLSKS